MMPMPENMSFSVTNKMVSVWKQGSEEGVSRLFERKVKATDQAKTPEEKNVKEEADRWH